MKLLRRVRQECPKKDVWCYTGFIYDEDFVTGGRAHCEVTEEMLSYLDVLVDGPFIEEQKDITLLFRGSKNQRIIHLDK